MIVTSNVINMVLQLLYYSMNHVIFLNLYRFLLKLCWMNKHCQYLNAIEISYLKFPLVINYVFYNRQTHTLQAMNWIVSLCTINSKIKIKSALVKSLDQVTVLTVARCTLSQGTFSDHMQFLCQVWASNLSPLQDMRRDELCILFTITFNFHKWPRVKIMTNPQAIINLYVKWKLPKLLHKKGMNW